MQRYLLTIQQPKGGVPAPAALEKVMRDVNALIAEAKKAGVLVFNGGLEPPERAAVVRLEGETLHVTDGPYVESKEFVGGLLIVRAPDRDAAIDWARKAARAIGLPIELRAFQGGADDGES